MTKHIVIKVPPNMDDTYSERIDKVIEELKVSFPDREIVKVPMDVQIQFVD